MRPQIPAAGSKPPRPITREQAMSPVLSTLVNAFTNCRDVKGKARKNLGQVSKLTTILSGSAVVNRDPDCDVR